MKKYFLGVVAILAEVALSAFMTPKKIPAKPDVNYYLFDYQTPSGSFAQYDVQNEDVAHWGYGTLVADRYSFTLCDGIDQKACQIIVTNANVIFDGTGRRLKTAGDPGDKVVLFASEYHSTGKYYVNSSSANLANRSNKLQ